MNADLPYPPPWMDSATLGKHICVSPTTIDNWVAQGVLPPPRKRGGKLMWKWQEVDERLTLGADGQVNDLAERIRANSRRALDEARR